MNDEKYCNKYNKLVCNVFPDECRKNCIDSREEPTITCDHLAYKKIYTPVEYLELRKSAVEAKIKVEEKFMAETSCRWVEQRRTAFRRIDEAKADLVKIEKDIAFEKKLEAEK